MSFFSCPRSFVFCDVPNYHGEPLLEAVTEAEYEFYTRWLVDYLEGVAGQEIPEVQRALCAEMDLRDPLFAVRCLGDDAFYHYLYMQSLERCIEDGLSYEEAVAEHRAWWEEYCLEMGDIEPEPFEEWINPELWQEAIRELAERKAMPFPATHADLGYRIPLARALAREASPEKRLELVDSFYESFNEEAAK